MNSPDTQKWVKLTFMEQNAVLRVSYEDGWGNKAAEPIGSVQSIDPLLKTALQAFPRERQTGIEIVPVPLAVYLEDGGIPEWRAAHPELTVITIFDEFFGQYKKPEYSVQPVILLNESLKTSAFSLPLDIRFSGRGAKAMKGLIHNQSWGFWDKADEKFGIRVTSGSFMQAPAKRDILVLRDKQADAFLNHTFETSPRFVILLVPFKDLQKKWSQIQQLKIPCLCVGYQEFGAVSSFVREYIYSIIHDFSLHESLFYATGKSKPLTPLFNAVLFASPISNQSLRMSTALESYKKKAAEYWKVMMPGNLDAFISKFDDPSHAAIRDTLSSLLSTQQGHWNILDRARSIDLVFHGENTGLIPLASEERQFRQSLPRIRKINTGLSSLVAQPGAFPVLREKQERKVDISLDEFNSSLVYNPVSNMDSLRAGARYRLNVSIGQSIPSIYNLMSGDLPSIDSLLPDPKGEEGHQLDVVVYPKDFTLFSPARQQVHLPLLGATTPIHFQLAAPKPTELAELRVVIFYQNHLLQAFLLSASVQENPAWNGKTVVRAVLDLCTTSRFTNLDMLEPRALYLGMNGNGNGTHSIFIKKDDATREIDGLTEAVIANAQDGYRTLLEKAYFTDNNQIRFPTDAQPGSALTDNFFDELRKFAKFGSALYKEIFNQSGDEIKAALESLQESKGEDIQIGRYSMNYAFPWPMIYDYPLPLLLVGDPDAPVCMGLPFTERQYDKRWIKKGYGCSHNPDVICYCAEGFWGIRHKIEQIFSNDKAIDFADAITIKQSSKLFYSRNISDPPSDALTSKLTTYVADVFTVDQNSNLMDLLWDEGTRPPALIVLGHLETTRKAMEPEGPRIITFPRTGLPPNTRIPPEKWIYADLLLDYCQRKKRWSHQPLPLVMLINCDSADLSIASLNSIVKGFHTAGAAAIIGTECRIASGLGSRFIEEVLEAMYKKDTKLGDAIQQFNRRLFASGIPLAFVFTCYGNISLKLSK